MFELICVHRLCCSSTAARVPARCSTVCIHVEFVSEPPQSCSSEAVRVGRNVFDMLNSFPNHLNHVVVGNCPQLTSGTGGTTRLGSVGMDVSSKRRCSATLTPCAVPTSQASATAPPVRLAPGATRRPQEIPTEPTNEPSRARLTPPVRPCAGQRRLTRGRRGFG